MPISVTSVIRQSNETAACRRAGGQREPVGTLETRFALASTEAGENVRHVGLMRGQRVDAHDAVAEQGRVAVVTAMAAHEQGGRCIGDAANGGGRKPAPTARTVGGDDVHRRAQPRHGVAIRLLADQVSLQTTRSGTWRS